VDIAAREVWHPRKPEIVADVPASRPWTKRARQRVALMERRGRVRIGMPRVLNMYVYAPFFSAYFESLGMAPGNLVYSDFTSNDLYRQGAGRGSIDPCFPSKVCIAHVHNLLYTKHAKKPLDAIFFPMVDMLQTPLTNVVAANACPTVAVTPNTVKAAFTNESNVFAELGVTYLDPMVNFSDRALLGQQLFRSLGSLLGLSPGENERAIDIGFRELAAYETSIRRRARVALDDLERTHRLGIVLLARPYHHDPGLNHEILVEFQKLGYPIFSQSTLPLDEDLLERLFGDEVRAGVIQSPLDIQDVWKNSFAASTNHKIWAAKFTARHPNLVAVEMSSFKCGHDAPIYSTIEAIIEQSGTPYFSFKDIDENKPAGAIKIRVETIHYFLKRYAEQGIVPTTKEIEEKLAEHERVLREAIVCEEELGSASAFSTTSRMQALPL
jgi:predicted nucleotide-binding protein (sugar kinase/HSP70/actin superfamily)